MANMNRKQQKAMFAQLKLNKKSNRELNKLLNDRFVIPEVTEEIEQIFDKRMEADPEFQKHKREQEEELRLKFPRGDNI